MITVACVFKTGGDFNSMYVERLVAGIKRHLTLPHEFVCLTDQPDTQFPEVDRIIPLKYNWPGWWSKIEIFGLPGPVLYLDLDTILTGPLDELAAWIIESEDSLLMVRDFYLRLPSSGILGWNGDLKWILEGFIRNYAKGATWRKRPNATWLATRKERFRGDQEWLRAFLAAHSELSIVLAQDIMPGIYSYKVHVRGRPSPPTDAKIVCFHGRPRVHEVSTLPWVQQFWGNTEDALPSSTATE